MNSRRCGYKKINLNAEDAKDFAKGAAEYWCSLKKWHGRPAREDTRKMRVPHQTAPALEEGSPARLCEDLSIFGV